jgi:voltage-gated sodium channel
MATQRSWRGQLAAFVDGDKAQMFITLVILANAVTLGLETSHAITERFGHVLDTLDVVFLSIFVIELLLKLIALGPRFFLSAWNIFDFIIIGISLVPATGSLRVLRALRILRALRLVRVFPRLRIIVEGVLRVLPDLAWVFLLMMLVYYVFAVLGTKLYGATMPEYFGNIGATYYTLFQLMTLEGWAEISRDLLKTHPWSYIYFVSYMVISTFIVMNMVIAVVVNAFQGAIEGEPAPAVATEKTPKPHPVDLEEEIRRLHRKLNRLHRMLSEQGGGQATGGKSPQLPDAPLT